MGVNKIKTKIDQLAQKNKIANQTLWDMFFFENILYRLSKSQYKNKFIFKGGFLLGSMVGITERTTLDLDLKYIGVDLDENVLLNIFNNICAIKEIDEIDYEILEIKEIIKTKKYSGKQIKIKAKFFNISKIFSIDIAKGDIVTPSPIKYSYRSKINDLEFEIFAYSKETILAEKIETLISKGVNNSRSKDLFDIYLLSKEGYNKDIFNSAIINTFHCRNTILSKNIYNQTKEILSTPRIKELFDNYVDKNKFTKGLSFECCKQEILNVINNIVFNEIIEINDMEIDLLRHGEDDQNYIGGWSDNKLSDKGILQVQEISKLIDNNYDLIISSDLQRAKETSKIISNYLKIDIVYNDKLREINNGDLKNLTKEQFLSLYPGLYYNTLKIDESYPNGESPIEFYNRVKEGLIEITKNYKNKKILIVTHSGVMTVIKCLVTGWKYSNLVKIIFPYATLIKLDNYN